MPTLAASKLPLSVFSQSWADSKGHRTVSGNSGLVCKDPTLGKSGPALPPGGSLRSQLNNSWMPVYCNQDHLRLAATALGCEFNTAAVSTSQSGIWPYLLVMLISSKPVNRGVVQDYRNGSHRNGHWWSALWPGKRLVGTLQLLYQLLLSSSRCIRGTSGQWGPSRVETVTTQWVELQGTLS